MKTKSYIIDESRSTLTSADPFSDPFIKIKYGEWNDFLDTILSKSQRDRFYDNSIKFQISDKKIAKAIERFGRCDN